jgi:uncharacterized membrane protein
MQSSRPPSSPYSESDLKKFYRESLPLPFWVLAALLLLIAGVIAFAGFWSAFTQKTIFSAEPLPALGQQGDFFGGHFSAILGLVTIVFVVASFLLERQRARRSALRDTFLRGVDQITESRRTPPQDNQSRPPSPVDPVTLRLVNYYARVALANPDEELLLILNIPITGSLRTAIEEDAKGRNDYPFAWEALKKYRASETQMHRGKKGIE